MKLEQAIFTSARTSRYHGYQVVARSSGISDRLVQSLAQWGPTHGSLIGEGIAASSLNYLPIDHDHVALSRTVHGGPEYSARGALQVFTTILIARRSQLSGYKCNPADLAQTAMLLGHLRLTDVRSRVLPAVELPTQSPRALTADAGSARADDSLIERAVQTLRSHRVAVVGTANPMRAISGMIDRLPPATRLDTSFTTGLVPSHHRQFRVHLLPSLDTQLHQRLSQQGIRFVASEV